MRNFTNSLITQYKGAFGAQPITAHQKSINPPQGVSLTVSWYQYALAMNIAGGVTVFNGGVGIDLTRSQVQAPLDIIKSVFIDNTAVDRPVYLRCEDTGQVVTCADSSFGWFPVITNGEQFTLFTDNIIPLRDGRQQTRLIFSNAAFDTFGGSEYNRAQALYRGSGTSNFITAVLGDKLLSGAIVVTTGVTQNITIEPATPNSQIVLTGMILGVYGNDSGTSNANTNIEIQLTGYGGLLYDYGPFNYYLNRPPLYFINNNNLQQSINGSTDLILSFINRGGQNALFLYTVQYAKILLPALS